MSQPSLVLLLCLVKVLEGTVGSFLRPLTCQQDISYRKICGSAAEQFYPNQCHLKNCCYRNLTCYHHAIDGPLQRRNAGIIAGLAVAFVIFSTFVFLSCKLKTYLRKEREKEDLSREGEMADFTVRLLDEEGDYRRPESMAYSWPEESFFQQPSWMPGSQEALAGLDRPAWKREMTLQPGPGPVQPLGVPGLMMPGSPPALAPPPAPQPVPTLAPAPLPAPAPTVAPAPAPPMVPRMASIPAATSLAAPAPATVPRMASGPAAASLAAPAPAKGPGPAAPSPAAPGPAAPGPAAPGPAAPGPAAPGPAAPGPGAPGSAVPGPAASGSAAPGPAAPSPSKMPSETALPPATAPLSPGAPAAPPPPASTAPPSAMPSASAPGTPPVPPPGVPPNVPAASLPGPAPPAPPAPPP